nr:hypothetical protein [Histophilus somni]
MISAHASNKIENVDMGDEEFASMLERAKSPISDEEFAFQEISRVYSECGLSYVKSAV